MLFILEIAKKVVDRSRSGIWCFNFHQIAVAFDPQIHMRGTFTDLRAFEKYVKFFKNNFDLVSVATALELQKSKAIKGKFACITFDDGDATIENAISLLISECVPASFFLNSAYIKGDAIDPFRVANYLLHDSVAAVDQKRLIKLTKTLRRTMSWDDFRAAKEELRFLQSGMPVNGSNLYVKQGFLNTVDNSLISFGLHGHEHDRFILMDYAEQKLSLEKNIEFVSHLKGYIPVFAMPFGRPLDWNGTTINVCNDLELDFLFANGGVNSGDEVGLKRIPADNRNLLFEMRIGYFQ